MIKRILLVLLVVLCANSAQAQRVEHVIPRDSTNGEYTTAEVYLARLCTNEVTWDMTDDCAAIYQVIMYMARFRFTSSPVPFERAAMAYSPTVFGRCQFPTRRNPAGRCRGNRKLWVLYLTGDLEQPRYWPYASSLWDERRQASWQARLNQSRNIISGLLPSPCDFTPMHWGSQDHTRRVWREKLRSGEYQYANCGDTMNAFIYKRSEAHVRPVGSN